MPSTADDRAIQPVTLTYPEAADYMGVSLATVKRLVADGSLRHVPIGRAIRFRREDLDRYLDREARGGR